jgi:transposase-like protein
LRQRAVRLVAESKGSEWSAITSIAAKLGIRTAETLRTWVRQAEIDTDARSGVAAAQPGRHSAGPLYGRAADARHGRDVRRGRRHRTVAVDPVGRLVWASLALPGSGHDLTARPRARRAN